MVDYYLMYTRFVLWNFWKAGHVHYCPRNGTFYFHL